MDKEVKYGPVLTGRVDPAKAVTNAGARPGDCLMLTKPIGVGIIDTAVKRGGADAAIVEGAIASMTQLNRQAAERMLETGVHASTDITGFGLLGHAQEMARASDVTLQIDHAAILTISGALELCVEGIKPGGLENNRLSFADSVKKSSEISDAFQDLLFDSQTSGGLLMALPEKAAAGLQKKISESQETGASIIGRVTPGKEGGALVIVE